MRLSEEFQRVFNDLLDKADLQEQDYRAQCEELGGKIILIVGRIEHESTNKRATPEARANARYLLESLMSDPLRDEIVEENQRNKNRVDEHLNKDVNEEDVVGSVECAHCKNVRMCTVCKCGEPVCARCKQEMKSTGDYCIGG